MTSWLTNDRVDLGLLTATGVVTITIVGIVFGEMVDMEREALREAAEKTATPGMHWTPETFIPMLGLALLVVYIQTQLPDDESEDNNE
jgi:hypothetical protein